MNRPPPPPRAPLSRRRRSHVLVVEGEPQIQGWLVGALRQWGFEATGVADGVQAMARLAQIRDEVDLVLADWVLPRMGGAELLDALAAQYPGLPVILTTSHALDAQELARPNVFVTMRKPVASSTLRIALQRALPIPVEPAPRPALELEFDLELASQSDFAS